eukprot:5958380-Alexandrium_andersonii.AAC.1
MVHWGVDDVGIANAGAGPGPRDLASDSAWKGPRAARPLRAARLRLRGHAARDLLQSPRWASGPQAPPGQPPPVWPPEGPAHPGRARAGPPRG